MSHGRCLLPPACRPLQKRVVIEHSRRGATIIDAPRPRRGAAAVAAAGPSAAADAAVGLRRTHRYHAVCSEAVGQVVHLAEQVVGGLGWLLLRTASQVCLLAFLEVRKAKMEHRAATSAHAVNSVILRREAFRA